MEMRWGLGLAVCGMVAVSAYGCGGEDLAIDSTEDDDEVTRPSSSGRTERPSSSSSGELPPIVGSSSGSQEGTSSGSQGTSSGSQGTSSGSVLPPSDAGIDILPDASVGEGGVDDAGVPLACPGDLGPVGYWGRSHTYGPGSCSATRLTEFYTACLGDNSSTAACDAFVGAYGTCASCLIGDNDNNGALLPYSTGVIVNLYGCASFHANDPTGDDECADILTNSLFCPFENCASCDEDRMDACLSNVDDDDVNGCGQIAEFFGFCAEYNSVLESDAEACGDVQGATFRDLFMATAGVLCGTP